METAWDSELAGLLTDLLKTQDETLEVLTRKRQLIVDADAEGLAAVGKQEEKLIERLQQCLERREELLKRAAEEGLPSDSVRSLTAAVPKSRRGELTDQVKLAAARSRLLEHHSLTNWVLMQRTLIHLSQMLEIIATGGRLQPTYGKSEPAAASGALVDRAV